MLYFAYGSNLPLVRIRSRLASAQFYVTARLPGYLLRFHKSGRDGSAKCDIQPCDEDSACVHGAVYRIDSAERDVLDRFEGPGYHAVEIDVDSDHGRLGVFAYRAVETDTTLRPYTWYREHVIRGALEHGFPDAYLQRIRTVAVIDDPDANRHAKEMAIYRQRD